MSEVPFGDKVVFELDLVGIQFINNQTKFLQVDAFCMGYGIPKKDVSQLQLSKDRICVVHPNGADIWVGVFYNSGFETNIDNRKKFLSFKKWANPVLIVTSIVLLAYSIQTGNWDLLVVTVGILLHILNSVAYYYGQEISCPKTQNIFKRGNQDRLYKSAYITSWVFAVVVVFLAIKLNYFE